MWGRRQTRNSRIQSLETSSLDDEFKRGRRAGGVKSTTLRSGALSVESAVSRVSKRAMSLKSDVTNKVRTLFGYGNP